MLSSGLKSKRWDIYHVTWDNKKVGVPDRNRAGDSTEHRAS